MRDDGTDATDDSLRTRRQVLRSAATITTTAGILDTAGASTGDETGTTGSGATERGGLTTGTERSTKERRLQWTARHRNHYTLKASDLEAADVTWHGISDTTLRLVDVAYQPFGNPLEDADDPGCWRYTFSVGSVAAALMPFPGVEAGNPAEVTKDQWMLADRRLHPTEAGETTKVKDTIRVMGPEPDADEGEVNPQLDAVAIAARRSPELFSIINGEAVVSALEEDYMGDDRDLEGYRELGWKFGDMTPNPYAHVGSSTDVIENYALKAQRANEVSKDLKTGFDLGRGFLGLLSEWQDWSRVGKILGPVGAFFDLEKLGESIYELAFRDAADKAANWQGFEVTEEDRAAGPLSGHQYVFDVYVAPGERTAVTVQSVHELMEPANHQTDDSGPIGSLGDPEWTIEFDAPLAPEEATGLTDEDTFNSASVTTVDATNPTPQHAWPAINARSSVNPEVDEWSKGNRLILDAYDTAVSDSRDVGYTWTVETCNRQSSSRCSRDASWLEVHESAGRELWYRPSTPGNYRVTLTVTEFSDSSSDTDTVETETTMQFEVS